MNDLRILHTDWTQKEGSTGSQEAAGGADAGGQQWNGGNFLRHVAALPEPGKYKLYPPHDWLVLHIWQLHLLMGWLPVNYTEILLLSRTQCPSAPPPRATPPFLWLLSCWRSKCPSLRPHRATPPFMPLPRWDPLDRGARSRQARYLQHPEKKEKQKPSCDWRVSQCVCVCGGGCGLKFCRPLPNFEPLTRTWTSNRLNSLHTCCSTGPDGGGGRKPGARSQEPTSQVLTTPWKKGKTKTKLWLTSACVHACVRAWGWWIYVVSAPTQLWASREDLEQQQIKFMAHFLFNRASPSRWIHHRKRGSTGPVRPRGWAMVNILTWGSQLLIIFATEARSTTTLNKLTCNCLLQIRKKNPCPECGKLLVHMPPHLIKAHGQSATTAGQWQPLPMSVGCILTTTIPST